MEDKVQPRKLPNDLECYIENAVYKIVDPLSKVASCLNLTPNDLTTISLLFGIAAIYFLYKHRRHLFVVCFLLFYLFDCLDGYYARKYGMCSKFGDYYDHIKDAVVMLPIITIILFRLYKRKKYVHMAIIFFCFLMFGMVMSCQELYLKEHDTIPKDHSCHSETLSIINLCKDYKWLKYIRFFGMGFFILLLNVKSFVV